MTQAPTFNIAMQWSERRISGKEKLFYCTLLRSHTSLGSSEQSSQIAGVQVCHRDSHVIKMCITPSCFSIFTSSDPDVAIWTPYRVSLYSLQWIHSQENKEGPQVFVCSGWCVPNHIWEWRGKKAVILTHEIISVKGKIWPEAPYHPVDQPTGCYHSIEAKSVNMLLTTSTLCVITGLIR